MIFEAEDIQTLIDVGFIAWSHGFDAEAERIFEALRLMSPGDEAGYIGGALVSLRSGDALGAVEQLRRSAASDAVRVLLGLALLESGERDEALEILGNVAHFASDLASGRWARSILADARENDALA